MTRWFPIGWAGWVLVLSAGGVRADEPPRSVVPEKSAPAAAAQTVEQIAASVKPSIVVIRVKGRDGKREGLGTGFVVGADGLIATNLHVIGEARPITVEMADGRRYDVTAVEASDRAADLAVVRIQARRLVPLPLGDSDQLKQGQAVVAVGNPRGLERSVVAGVVSGRRTIEGRPMIQLAIPIEAGNSGGPLLDLQGRVQGILTLKSLVTANLGFATAVNSLKALLAKPNPIPMERWLTLGALDPGEWKPLLGARWRHRGGRIVVDGLGGGFGGRSLCLWQRPVPAIPFEVAVTVRLDDEAGAAGLVFHADGGDKHYGFYPTGGRLRLTRFEGPDVFAWKILRDAPSPHYRPGDWNTIKVRVEKDKLRCLVNDHLVFESDDTGLAAGQVGLAKFRDTKAEFKDFRVAKQIPPATLPVAVKVRVAKAVEGLNPLEAVKPAVVESLAPDAPASVAALRDQAKLLERQAAQVRQLAQAVHQRHIQAELLRVLRGREEDIDLVHAALLIARLDNDEVDVDAYRKEIDRMAREVAAAVPTGKDDQAKLAALNKYLFTERGFHGSRGDYYNRSNSYLNEVLDDREGLPITLAVLYLELGRRVGLNLVGIGLPGHFVVEHRPAEGAAQLLDIFDGGKPLSREEAAQKVKDLADRPLKESDLVPVTKRAILVRILHNLLGLAQWDRDAEGMLRYLDTILALTPDAAEERGTRALLRYQAGRRAEALADVDWLLEHRPAGLDTERLLEFRRAIEHGEGRPSGAGEGR